MNTAAHPTAGHFITFKLGDELFAINVAHVREVLDLSSITKVPTAPAYLRGVVNVRGNAIPVVDFRTKFGLPKIPDSVQTRIVVVDLILNDVPTVIGGLADSVHEVIEIHTSSIREPPRVGMRWKTDWIQGIGQRGDAFIILIDIGKIFATDENALGSETLTSEEL